MNLIVNGDIHQSNSRMTLHDLLQELNCPATNIAVAVNYTLIPKSAYINYWLQDADKIEIVNAYQGG